MTKAQILPERRVPRVLPVTTSFLDIGSELDTELSRLRLPTSTENPFRLAILAGFRGHADSELPMRQRRPVVVDRESLDIVLARLAPSLTLPVQDLTVTLTFRSLDDFLPAGLWASAAFDDLRQARQALGKRASSRATVDKAIAGRLRAILHHPDFQILESSWRALSILVQRIDPTAPVRLEMLDVSATELTADLMGEATLEKSAAFQLLTGGNPYSLILGDYYFSQSQADLDLLHRVGALAARAHTPVLTGAAPRPTEWCEGTSEAWDTFCQTTAAVWVGLALPRFLVRLPHSTGASDTAELVFDEIPEPPSTERLCWANSAWLCALAMTLQYVEEGAGFEPRMMQEIERLPLYIYTQKSDMRALPCAELKLEESQALRLIERGLIPVTGVPDTDRVQILQLQSAARTKLMGRWGAT